jgi:hypothetical protein
MEHSCRPLLPAGVVLLGAGPLIMRTVCYVTALVVFSVVHADDVVARRRGKLPPPPTEIEADARFRDAFIEVMAREGRDWQLQPSRPRGPARSGRPPLAHEEMAWRRDDGSDVRVSHARFASSEDAEVALAWRRELINVGTWVVKGMADEAYYATGSRALLFRRGAFMFTVRYEPSGPRGPLEPVNMPHLCPRPENDCVVIANGEAVLVNGSLRRISALFLAAADGVLSDPKRP